MRTVMFELRPPSANQVARMVKPVEQIRVQAFAPHAPVKVFNRSVLHRFARCNVVPVNFVVFLPL